MASPSVANAELTAELLQRAIDQHLDGKPELAEPIYQRFVEAGSGLTVAYTNLAAIELARGASDRAVQLWHQALALDASLAETWYDLGNEFQRRANRPLAKDYYLKALDLRPHFPELRCNLASLLLTMGEHQQALEQADQAVEQQPELMEAELNRASALRLLKRLPEAEQSARRSLSLAPQSSKAQKLLAAVLLDAGELVEAEASLRQALELNPQSPELTMSLAQLLQKNSRLAEALALLEPLQLEHPKHQDVLMLMGQLLFFDGKYLQALDVYRRLAALKPDLADVHYNLGVVLKEAGQLEAAAVAYAEALRCQPNHENAFHGLGYTLNFGQLEPMPQLAARLHAWTTQHYPAQDRSPFVGRSLPLSGGKLRIGFVSAELGNHAVAMFLGSVLEHYNRDQFELYLYESAERSGEERERAQLLPFATKVLPIHGLNDVEARQCIINDKIDVLIDTTGCMRGSRLAMLARRCAPVQCHYIGFHGSSGVEAIDWYIGDSVYTPPAFDGHLLERVWRLPRCFVAYRPTIELPPLAEIDNSQPLTLGCFNNLIKVRSECLNLWVQVLRGLPQAKLLLKDVRARDLLVRERILNQLSIMGIGAERVEFAQRVPSWQAHMALYNRVDLALDTVPLNSGTTAFDALVMGVPLLALRGEWMGGCITASLLTSLGRGDWIRFSEAEYCRAIWRLAADLPALRALKPKLRQEVLNSALCDGAQLTRGLEQAWCGMVGRWNQEQQASRAFVKESDAISKQKIIAD
jgi:predicted O-linked N-acetylglucosamine transferase (SPINDLY family)